MKEIVMRAGGGIALVDDEDFDTLNAGGWWVNGAGYATRRVRSLRTTLMMHRVVVSAPRGVQVHHVNGERLDNRKANLRICTQAQNNVAQPIRASGSSPYRGVHRCSRADRFIAKIRIDGRSKYLGTFTDEIEAAVAYDAAARECHGEFAALNFAGTP